MKRKNLLTNSLFISIILLAFIVRVYRLASDTSFSTDEVTTVTASMQKIVEIPKLQSRTPLQAFLVGFGARVLGLGYSEFAVYILSVIVSVLAVMMVYHLGRVMFDYRVGLLSAFMLAFSAYYIYWSRSARYYALMVLLSSVAFFCLYSALTTNHRRSWLIYVLFRTLSLYDHLTALWILAGEGVFTLAYISSPFLVKIWKGHFEFRFWRTIPWRIPLREIARRFANSRFFWLTLSMVLIFLASAPVWYPLVRDIYLGSSALRLGGLSSEQLAPRDPRSAQLQSVLGGGWQGPFIVLHLLAAWVTPLHVLLLFSFTIGLLFTAQRRQWIQLLFVLTIMVTPFALAGKMKSYSLVLNGRYLVSLLPLYYTMISRGISGFGDWIANLIRLRETQRSYLVMAVMSIFACGYAGLNYTRIPLTYRNTGQNWRAVSQFLVEKARPEQPIVVHGTSTLSRALQYYMPEYNVIARDTSQSDELFFEENDTFWLVYHPGTDMYAQHNHWVENFNTISLIFTGGWYPDIDRTTDLAPGLNWDLYVVYVDQSITSAEEALNLQDKWLADVSAQNPDDVRQHLTMAEAYQRFDRCDLAVTEYSLALKEGYINEQLASYIYDARGRCWYMFGNIELAVADWKRSIALADWSKKPYEQLDFAYTESGRVVEAQTLYQAALKANPGKAWPHVLLGRFYARQGHSERAIDEYSQAIELEPGDRTAYQYLGWVYTAEREFYRVISLYQDAVKRNPLSGWPYIQLGHFYQGNGKISEAVKAYQRAVELQSEYTSYVSDLLLNIRWDLARKLNVSQVYSDIGELLWWPGSTWVKPYPDEPEVVLGTSKLMVQGHVQSNQLLLHPFSSEQNTYIEFELADNPFIFLDVGYGLADEAAGLGNGVQYRFQVKRDGYEAFDTILDALVTENVWEKRLVSLAPYWGEDLVFRLSVDALGDDTFDWLQTTVELAPPQQPIWDLAANLKEASISVYQSSLELREDGFYTTGGDLLVGLSEALVDGQSLPGQVALHPYSLEEASNIIFTLPIQPYRLLKTSFGLADEALPHSDGVNYSISVSVDSGQSFLDLLQTTVTDNIWQSVLVDLPISRDLMIKLTISAREDIAKDWLQVRLVLLPFEEEAR